MKSFILLLSLMACLDASTVGDPTDGIASSVRLECYVCNTIFEGDDCLYLDDSEKGKSFRSLCKEEEENCMIKRFSHATIAENGTTTVRLWAMRRNCSRQCKPGCIITGERTKLHVCTSCCARRLCNYGSVASGPLWISVSVALCCSFLYAIFRLCQTVSL